jgi:flagellar biosynthetic protein FlhB
MSEEEGGQEKTEQPTERRLTQAIEQGQILTSKDLIMAMVLLVAAFEFSFFGRYFFTDLVGNFSNGLDFADPLLRGASLTQMIGERFESAILLILSFSAPLALAAILTQMGLGGFHISFQNLAFKASRISPLAGLSRMFGPSALIELSKSILKVIALGAVGFWFLMDELPQVVGLSEEDLGSAVNQSGSLFLITLFVLIGAIAILGMGDGFLQWYKHNQQMMMTKQEVKEEFKQSEGSPEIKQRIRRMQQEVAQRGSVASVEKAQVIIVNPKNFAVALRYDFEDGTAPKVLSKGTDSVAASIREKAQELGIPILKIPLLARALYYTSEIGAEIHSELYRAVATVLTFVYQAGAQGDIPDIEVPPELQFDANGRKLKEAQ